MLLLSALLALAPPAPGPRDAAAARPVPQASPADPAPVPRASNQSPVPRDSLPPPAPGASPADPAPAPEVSPADPEPVPQDIFTDPPPVPNASPLEPAPPALDDPRPTFRTGFGAAFAARSPPATGVGAGFAFDLALGATFQVGRRVYLWPELGYSLALRDQRVGHFFIAGLAPMFGSHFAQIGVAPRLVAGDAWGAPGVGVRSGVVASFLQNLMILELGHQWLRAGGRDLHDGRFMLSVDLVVGAAIFAIFRGGARILRRLR